MASIVEQYIRQRAPFYGVDPNVAVRVASAEAMNVFDPNKPDRGGDGGSSFGPFQLHYGGLNPSMPHAGLGDDFTAKTGLNARDPSTWQQQVDFALGHAAKGGWSPWMGAKAAGVAPMQGIGAAPPPLSPQAANFVQNNPQPGGFGAGVPDPNAAPSSILGPSPQPSPLGPPGIPNDVAQYAAADEQKTPGQWLHGAFQKLQNFPDAPAVRFGPMGDARNSGGDLLKAMNAPTLSDLLSKKRLVG